MKHCTGCITDKKESEFYASKGSPDGLNRYCIQCCKVNRAIEAVKKRDKRVKLSNRQLYRAKQEGIKYDTGITLAAIFKRDRGVCYLCNKWVTPGKASLEHVRPIIKGGTHTWDNVKLSHLKCNLRKGDRDA